MRARLVGGVLAVGFAALSVVACSDDDSSSSDGSTTTGREVTSTTAAGAGTTTTVADTVPVDEGTDDDVLVDGKHFGYITTLVAGHNEIVGSFDLAQLFTGQEAIDAAHEDGSESEGDFYIRNVNAKERPILVDPEAVVLDVDYDACCDPKSSTPAQFVADRDDQGETRTPCYVTVAAGKVTKIEELYLP